MKRFRQCQDNTYLSSVKHQIDNRETGRSMILCFHKLQVITVPLLIVLWSIMLLTSLCLLTLLIRLTPSDPTNSIQINYLNEFIICSNLTNFAESKRLKFVLDMIRESTIKFGRHILPDIEIF